MSKLRMVIVAAGIILVLILLGVLGFRVFKGEVAGLGFKNSAAAAVGLLSFGGRIAVVIPCISPLGPSLWVQLAIPASPLLPPYEYIWTPATLVNLPPAPTGPPIPPTHPGQEIMGLFDIPFACFTPTLPPIPLFGYRMTIEQSSPI